MRIILLLVVFALVFAGCTISVDNSSDSNSVNPDCTLPPNLPPNLPPSRETIITPNSILVLDGLNEEDQEFADALIKYVTDRRKVDRVEQPCPSLNTALNILNPEDLDPVFICEAKAIFLGLGSAERAREFGVTHERVLNGEVRSWFGYQQSRDRQISLPIGIVKKIYTFTEAGCPRYDDGEYLPERCLRLFCDAYDFSREGCNAAAAQQPGSYERIDFYERFAIQPSEDLEQEMEDIISGIESCFSLPKNINQDIRNEFTWINWDECQPANESLNLYFENERLKLAYYVQSLREYGETGIFNFSNPQNSDAEYEREKKIRELLYGLAETCVNHAELAEDRGVGLAVITENSMNCFTGPPVPILREKYRNGLEYIARLLTEPDCAGVRPVEFSS